MGCCDALVAMTDERDELRATVEKMQQTWLSPAAYEALMQERSETLKELASAEKQRDELLTAINECYQMLLTEQMAKTAADRAEAMLREALERTK